MKKYRIIFEYGLYYPQVRHWLGFWHNTSEPTAAFDTKEEAMEEIEKHKRIFSKKPKEVVWESEC